MKHLRLLCATATLICAFAFSAYAGNIECPAATSAPPPQTTETADGNIECPAMTSIIVTVIESILALP
jgi:hypothetical protein